MAETSNGDRVLRAITEDNNFRVMVAVTTATVNGAIAAQKTSGDTARLFGELLTGAVLIRETMSPHHRVQAILKDTEGSGSLVADSHPDGTTRGLVQPTGSPLKLGNTCVLQMMRSMAKGVHRSVVQAPREGGIAAALMTYMQESEQIVCVIATGIIRDGDNIVQAGGYVIQLLPEAARGPLMVMTQRLETLAPVGELLATLDGSPHKLMDELLYAMPYAQLDDRPVHYGCRCSRQAVVASLASLGRAQLTELLESQEVIELSCDYCQKDYKIGRQHLEGLLRSS